MRILWVKVDGLWPLDSGGRLRSFHMIEELSRRHRVTLLTAHGPQDDPEGLAARLTGCERVISLPYAAAKHGSVRFALALARSWLSSLPVHIRKWRVPALRREVARLLAGGGKFDLCVADFLITTPNVPLDGPVASVLFAHNVEHMIWKRLSRVEPRLWRRALLALEWRKMRGCEARACNRARLTIAVSEADRAVLAAQAPRALIRAIPTGVDTAYFTPNGAQERPGTIVFTGAMDWFPNEDGIVHFVDAVFPRIRAAAPDATLTVVGRNPGPRVRQLAAVPGVRITGTVDDVRPHVAQAAVFVVPLRVGGGTRLKIFEALAMGKAVVSTTVGVEGLPLTPETHFAQADDPAQFAAAVVALLRDPARRHALGGAGRRLVEQRYSWSHVAREFEARCEEAIRHAR
ncbi:MAG TPA: glycosyltransferase [Gemmatimonadales bacterium]|nr:glycosyltransferase [Gemmatimonadales bacterium]